MCDLFRIARLAVSICVLASTSLATLILRGQSHKGFHRHRSRLEDRGAADGAMEQLGSPGNGLLFIGVMTAADNSEKRQAIRNTWMQNRDLFYGTVVATFFVGKASTADGEQRVITESETYGDIHRLEVKEGYEHLTEKTLSFFNWYDRNRDEPYVMKLDDDTWPHIPRIVAKLRAEQSRYLLLGHIFPCAPVLHDGSKWSENSQTPGIDRTWYFPVYPQGSGYILTQGVVHNIVDATPVMLHNEDAAVGWWVHKVQHISKVDVKHMNSTVYGCSADDLLTMNLWPGDMECMWSKQLHNRDNVCCDHRKEGVTGNPVSLVQGELDVDTQTLKEIERRHQQNCFHSQSYEEIAGTVIDYPLSRFSTPE